MKGQTKKGGKEIKDDQTSNPGGNPITGTPEGPADASVGKAKVLTDKNVTKKAGGK